MGEAGEAQGGRVGQGLGVWRALKALEVHGLGERVRVQMRAQVRVLLLQLCLHLHGLLDRGDLLRRQHKAAAQRAALLLLLLLQRVLLLAL